MIQIEVNNRKILMVEVPENYLYSSIAPIGVLNIASGNDHSGNISVMQISHYDWLLLGRGSDISETYAHDLVSKTMYDTVGPFGEDQADFIYFDYIGGLRMNLTAAESLHSLIKSKGLNHETTIILIEKQK